MEGFRKLFFFIWVAFTLDTWLTILASEAKHCRDRQARVNVNATGYAAENRAGGPIFGGVVVKHICP